MLWLLALLALTANVQGRAVNISNTWMLPEEGFPVFYRYFRDRISWYEADAVCQFHHANLVTVDTTAQYDAVRAYLKELDITSAVWVGLIRSNPDGDFTWTDYRGLSSEGYWSAAPDAGAAPLCAAADPAADYRWEARACGGPMVASFVCELPVPQWASGSQGCMVKSLPAVTILYLPESAAVQLTADCGLAGVRKIECTGNVKREELLKELSCIDDTNDTISTPAYELTTGSLWPLSTEKLNTNQQTTQLNTEDVTITEQVATEREIELSQPRATFVPEIEKLKHTTTNIEYHTVVINQDMNNLVNHDSLKTKPALLNTFNLESNDIPKLPEKDNFITEEETDKREDEKLMQHKMLHDELARLGNTGNFERIFTSSSDHFIPPLVMAKSRMKDDMEELSVHAKQAQQFAEEHSNRYEISNDTPKSHKIHESNMKQQKVTDSVPLTTNDTPTEITTKANLSVKDTITKDTKPTKTLPKKYSEKYYDSKGKNIKIADKNYKKKIEKVTDVNVSQINHDLTHETSESTIMPTLKPFVSDDSHSLELSVVLKEPVVELKELKPLLSTESKVYIAETKYKNSEPEISTTEVKSTAHPQTNVPEELTHKIVKVVIPNDKDESTPLVLEIATLVPLLGNSLKSENASQLTSVNENVHNNIVTTDAINYSSQSVITENYSERSPITSPSTIVSTDDAVTKLIMTTAQNIASKAEHNIAATTEQNLKSTSEIIANATTTPEFTTNYDIVVKTNSPEEISVVTDDMKSNGTESVSIGVDEENEPIDDFESPLLSGASEPLHRPNRSRRPQNQNHVKKFNPFRILG